MIRVAMADRNFRRRENELLFRVGHDLDLSEHYITGLIINEVGIDHCAVINSEQFYDYSAFTLPPTEAPKEKSMH